MITNGIEALARKCRFDPKMGGNREQITIPCTLMRNILYSLLYATYSLRSREELESINTEVMALLDEGVKITMKETT